MRVALRSSFYVITQFVAAAALVVSVDVHAMNPAAIVLILAGLILGVMAVTAVRLSQLSIRPEVWSSARLITSGPYRWIRHPMYTGLMLLTAGFTTCPFHAWKLGVWSVLLTVLWFKSTYEERLLVDRFPEYEEYRSRTARFIPFII